MGAGGKVTSEAVNTDPTATGVGRALTTLVELLKDGIALEEDFSGLTELLELLLDVESFDTGFEDVVAFDEDELFLVEEGTGVDFVDAATKAGVAVTALQT